MRGSPEIRFWSKVIKSSPQECWNWIGSKSSGGYGTFYFRERIYPSNRVAWILTHGDIPFGKFICHKCDNRSCCNPSHLFISDAKGNSDDMFQKGRGYIPISGRGSENVTSKLTDEQVREIKYLISMGIRQMDIASMFNMSEAQISRIHHKKRWAHLD